MATSAAAQQHQAASGRLCHEGVLSVRESTVRAERNGVEHVLCGSRSSERTPFMAAAEERLDARRRTKYYHMAPSEALRWHHPLLDQVDASNAPAPPGTSANKKGRPSVVANIERGTRASGVADAQGARPRRRPDERGGLWDGAPANRHVARVLALNSR